MPFRKSLATASLSFASISRYGSFKSGTHAHGGRMLVIAGQVLGHVLKAQEDRVADQVPAVQRGHDARLFGLPLGGALALGAAIVVSLTPSVSVMIVSTLP